MGMARPEKRNSHGREVFFEPFRRAERVRQTMTIQMNIPAVSRIWKNRGRSRNSHCCEKKPVNSLGMRPF
ncbi:Uncharacterised protein [Mycobacterium tuberculosis]|nr:Uncharacterised protein [Mycobacterium tuberculosis]